MMRKSLKLMLVYSCIFLRPMSAAADEGMWLFDKLPLEHLSDKYEFEPTQKWIRHVMLSCVRFNNGGSASFVSNNGLVLTNHHVTSDTLYKLSSAKHNYNRDGFLAQHPSHELPAPDLELNQLVSTEDVTDRVKAALKADMSAGLAHRARRAIMAKIEQESLNETGLRSDVITLYGGGRYHLYRYKKYTDVRLVWAPESAIAFFGGDADNFEYPRYCLDVALMRAYENGRPAQIDHFLTMSSEEDRLSEEELVFVAGNPGRTQRLFTVAALKFQRDQRVPYVLGLLRRREVLFQQFSLEGDEQARRVRDDLHGVQNARKAYGGKLQGLQDPRFMQIKKAREAALLEAVAGNPETADYIAAWQSIDGVHKRRKELLRQSGEFSGRYYTIAQQLVHMAEEDQKPSPARLRKYRDSNRDSLKHQLFSPAPIYDDLELLKFSDSLALFVEERGGDHPLAIEVLAGKSPHERAQELIQGTKLGDVAQRQRLATGGQHAIDVSDDPLIALAKTMSTEFRRLRKMSDELHEIERQAYTRIMQAQFSIAGTSNYPDATFTLRLAFGAIRGYTEGGERIPPWTTIGAAFTHEKNRSSTGSWTLPVSWKKNKTRLNLDTPFNFVCTADIIGGNSGSPVVNREAELVGVIFDGNVQSLTANYSYSDQSSRAIAVYAGAVRETLRYVYRASALADELGR